ncbi:hypothetical protein JTE90_006393 [Oedothorax gibbosus]|uniref:Selenocysteine lyase n=1 Tax=Oedothorax gibbosus TaxID=931172 RepID=A0AAV6VW93_9ARAC|nr:hypothetical protein JTE90_006393 [Oedothorax gibbosus]
MIYLDFNATTPIDSEVQKTICTSLNEAWGNPSSSYDTGKHAKSVIEDARRKVAEMIGSAPHEVIFTSGGTESNQMVISTACKNFHLEVESGLDLKIPHIITSQIEHDSIRIPLEKLVEERKAEVTFVSVCKSTGIINVDDIMKEIKPNTCLITLMLANNETGVIQPVQQLRPKLKVHKSASLCTILLHTDAAQALGKIEVDVDTLDIDYLTIVGHKFYGPRIGALYTKHMKPLYPLFWGGGQERNFRPGTENTPMIAGLGKAADLVTLNLEKYNQHMSAMCSYLVKVLKKCFKPKSVIVHFFKENRLPNTLSVAFDYECTGAAILAKAKNIGASTGSACHSGIGRPSEVLINSGIPADLAAKTIRLSVGRETTKEDINKAVKILHNAVKRVTFPLKL